MSAYFALFSIIGSLVIISLFLACFALGLISLCEYVEQKPNFLKKVVGKFIICIGVAHFGFILLDCLSLWRFLLSLVALSLHYRLHLDLPKLTLAPTLSNVVVVFLNHFMWLTYFFRNDHPMWEVISFYFFIIWAVPIAISIAYSTSEVLPGLYEGNSYKQHKRYY